MSELKAYMYDDMIDGDADTDIEYYPKSEADKVIAEKDAEIVELKKQIHDYTLGLFVIQAKAGKKLLHHKFKRCLAMAWWCSAELGMLVSTWESKIKYYKRWQKRWLELAEKFKEAK